MRFGHFEGIQVFLISARRLFSYLYFWLTALLARLYGCGEKSEAHFGSECLLGACYCFFRPHHKRK
jgi:hypothetical protein